jgi:hypothetical protein
MSVRYWLWDWLDENDISSVEAADHATRKQVHCEISAAEPLSGSRICKRDSQARPWSPALGQISTTDYSARILFARNTPSINWFSARI